MHDRGRGEPLDGGEVRAAAHFRSALQRFLKRSEQVTLGVGLTAQRYQLLLAVREIANLGEALVRESDEVQARLRVQQRSTLRPTNAPRAEKQLGHL